jgi:hypothetical protein
MGYLGWSPEKARRADVNDVKLALEPWLNFELAKAGVKREDIRPKKRGVSADQFKAFSRGVNQQRKAGTDG